MTDVDAPASSREQVQVSSRVAHGRGLVLWYPKTLGEIREPEALVDWQYVHEGTVRAKRRPEKGIGSEQSCEPLGRK